MNSFPRWLRLLVLPFLLAQMPLSAGEPLIPEALNKVLPGISANMTAQEVEKILLPAYPQVKSAMGEWGGQTGYINFKLDDRYTLWVGAHFGPDKTPIVSPGEFGLMIYVLDHKTKLRVQLVMYSWEKVEKK